MLIAPCSEVSRSSTAVRLCVELNKQQTTEVMQECKRMWYKHQCRAPYEGFIIWALALRKGLLGLDGSRRHRYRCFTSGDVSQLDSVNTRCFLTAWLSLWRHQSLCWAQSIKARCFWGFIWQFSNCLRRETAGKKHYFYFFRDFVGVLDQYYTKYLICHTLSICVSIFQL